MSEVKSFRDLLSRPFAVIEQEPTTGERKQTVVDGHSVVSGYAFLADFEVDKLIEALRKTVANEKQD